jgi:histidyl-tRNA synthetase
MADSISSVKGMNDLMPPESATWHRIESTARELFAAYGYGEIRTPVVEHTELFARGVGEATDIVGKEMYTFHDRATPPRSLTLRPEMTAGCVRAYIEHAIAMKEPITRWYYIAPMFRYERMQTGRYRQFWQIGCECFGIAEPTIDAEQIAMLYAFYQRLGVGQLEVCVNSVGSGEDRPRYRDALVAYFTPHLASLCPDCQRRIHTNPLRILDCKVEGCKAIAAGAPKIAEFLGEASRAHFDGVQSALAALDIPFRVATDIVRGLDYYTGTVFEILSSAPTLGKQSTVVGGGRYDGLVELLGGPATPAVGFALGVERAVLAMGADPQSLVSRPALFIATRGANARIRGTAIAHALRLAGVVVEVEHRDVGMKAQFKRGEKLGARFAIALGDDELKTGRATVRNMDTRDEVAVDLADAAALTAAVRGP